MGCNDVGSANPDIAGLGIIISFTIQASMSFCLSLWSVFLELRLGGLSFSHMCNQFRPTTLQNQSRAPGDLDPFRTRRELLVRILQPGGLSGFFLAGHSCLKPEDIRHINLQIDMIDHVLKVIGDTQLLNGISLLIGAFAQHETLELYHFHIVYDTVNFTGVSVAIAMAIVFKEPRAILHRGMLLFIFIALYLGFVVLFGLKLRSWDDNDPGRCYRSDKISGKDATHPYVDNVYLAITALWLFISLGYSSEVIETTIFVHLQRLASPEMTGSWPQLSRLFNSIIGMPQRLPISSRSAQPIWTIALARRRWAWGISSTDADFPLGIDTIRSHLGLFHPGLPQEYESRGMAQVHHPPTSNLGERILVLLFALVQYPVHSYMLYALRASNEAYLSGGSENEWGFGQVVALTLVASTCLECVRGTIRYNILKNERDDSKEGIFWKRFLRFLQIPEPDADEEAGRVADDGSSTVVSRRRSLPEGFKYT